MNDYTIEDYEFDHFPPGAPIGRIASQNPQIIRGKAKWIKGFEGYYKINEFGEVFSIARMVKGGAGGQGLLPVKTKKLTPYCKNCKPYLNLRKDSRMVRKTIESLMEEYNEKN